MSTTMWHADDDVLGAYARGDLDAAHCYSVEAHIVACGECQAAVARHVAADRLQATWLDIVDELDRPRVSVAERLLVRLGVSDHVARLLAATPSLTASWLLAMAVALGVAVAGAHQGDRGVALFLCVAALAPVAGVAAAFGRGIDPTHEIALAAPTSSARLLLLRTAAVVGTTLVLTAVAAIALPGVGWTAAAWLLPALGLTLAALALSTYLPHTTAFAGVTGAWLALTILSAARPGDALAAYDGAVQPLFALLAVLAAVVVARRRDALDAWGVR